MRSIAGNPVALVRARQTGSVPQPTYYIEQLQSSEMEVVASLLASLEQGSTLRTQ
jgi:hypothetical protein